MANELTISASLNYTKNNHQLTFAPTAQTIDVAGEQHIAGVQELGASVHEALNMGEVAASSQGYAFFRNIGTSADTHINVGVEVSSNFVPVFSLKGGEFAIMRLENQALFAKSSSGTNHLQYSILEE
jgi:hypothetical protein